MCKELIEAAQEFVMRVEKGEVQSVRTYNKFKTILKQMGEYHAYSGQGTD